jgi:diadenosine tetraphosphate (Ap4A) HIT family hydrolase
MTRPKTGCFFCERLNPPGPLPGFTLYADDVLHASHWWEEDRDTYLGQIVVQSVRHTPHGLASLTDDEGARVGVVVARLARALRSTLSARWAYTFGFTEGFRHYHQFVVARYAGTPAEHVRLGVLDWPEAPRGNAAEIRRRCARLRREVASPTGSPYEQPLVAPHTVQA